MDTTELLGRTRQAVLDGDAEAARKAAAEWLEGKGSPLQLIDEALTVAIREVGDKWEAGEYFLPELVSGAEAVKAAMGVLEPALAGQTGADQTKQSVVIGTVQGDIHDIGKSLVATMLSANGFAVTDLGADVSAERFLAAQRETGAGLICLSALLTTTMVTIPSVIRAFEEQGLRSKVRFLVGGAPITREWAREIGADEYGESAVDAVRAARALSAGA
jgi:corrinoid protein of di/trimethylamine methyltransferase